MTEAWQDHLVDEPAADSTAIELVETAHPGRLFATDDPVEIVVRATRVANALADVIQSKRLFVKISGKSYVVVEGWQLLGSMLGVTAVVTHTEEVEGGYKAHAEARRTLDGQVVGRAEAVCTKDEKRGPWKSADDFARLGMAQTRAISRSLRGPLGFIVALAGYEATAAEEAPPPEKPRTDQAVAEAPPERRQSRSEKAPELDAEITKLCVELDGDKLGTNKANAFIRGATTLKAKRQVLDRLEGDLDRRNATDA